MKKYFEENSSPRFFNKFRLLQAFGSLFSVAGNYFSFEYNNGNLLDDTKSLQDDWLVISQDMQLAANRQYFTHRPSSANHKVNAR